MVEKAIISITGPRFSGKTEAANAITQRCGIRLFDTDQIFVKQYNTTVAPFVAEFGWEGFRSAESAIIQKLYASLQGKAVVSLGGGALAHSETVEFREKNVEVVKGAGIVAYLLPSPDIEYSARVLAAREVEANNDPNRPPLPLGEVADMSVYGKTLATITKRHPLYLTASDGYVVYENDKTGTKEEVIGQKVDQIIKDLPLLLRGGPPLVKINARLKLMFEEMHLLAFDNAPKDMETRFIPEPDQADTPLHFWMNNHVLLHVLASSDRTNTNDLARRLKKHGFELVSRSLKGDIVLRLKDTESGMDIMVD